MRGIALVAVGFLLTGCGSSPGTSGNSQPPPSYPFPSANTLQFIHEFGTNTNPGATVIPGDSLTGLQQDGSGNLLLAGSTHGNLPGYSNEGIINKGALYKLDANGNQIWAKELSSGVWDAFDGLVVTASGIFVVGDTMGAYPGASNPNGIDEPFIAQYDGSGNLLWLKQYPSSSQGLFLEVLCADSSGNLIFAGEIDDSAGGQDLFVQKIDASGSALWENTFGNGASDLMNGMSTDANGDIYAVGATSGTFPGNQTSTISEPFVLKLDGATGATVWLQQFGDSTTFPIFYPSDVQAIPGGKLDVAGGNVVTPSGLPVTQIEVMQMDAATGSPLWHFQFGGDIGDIPGPLIVDPNGNIHVAGMTKSAFAAGVTMHVQDLFLAKIDPSGNPLWAQQFGTGLDGPPLVESLFAPFYLSLGNQGVYVGGMTHGQFPGFSNPNQYTDLFLAKFGQ